MDVKVIAIVGATVLTIAFFPFILVGATVVGSFVVDFIEDFVKEYIELWKLTLEWIKRFLKGGRKRKDGAECLEKQDHH